MLGVRLLRLEATVVLVPAEVTDKPLVRREPPRRALRLTEDAVGPGLVEAVRNLDRGAELLAEARRTDA